MQTTVSLTHRIAGAFPAKAAPVEYRVSVTVLGEEIIFVGEGPDRALAKHDVINELVGAIERLETALSFVKSEL